MKKKQRLYQTVVLLPLGEEQNEKKKNWLSFIEEKGGRVVFEKMEKVKFAYPIKRESMGVRYVFHFFLPADVLKKYKLLFYMDSFVLRMMTVLLPQVALDYFKKKKLKELEKGQEESENMKNTVEDKAVSRINGNNIGITKDITDNKSTESTVKK